MTQPTADPFGPEPTAYPLPHPASPDERFSTSLLIDVAYTLEAHGYPAPTGADWRRLHLALWGFLYQPAPAGIRNPGGHHR